MPRIYKGTTAKLALMYYPCVINPSDVSELTIAIYSEGTNEAIEYSLDNMTLKDNIAFINLAKYQLDILDNGVIKYVARGVYKGNDFVQDRYSNYYVQTPKDYEVEDVAIQDIKKVDVSELITNVLPDSGYDGMGEVIVDANPLINNVADNAVTLDVDKNGTYVAELADNYKGYIKEINVSVPSVNVEQLTQEEYDNITPDEDTLYVITDAPEIEIPDTSEFVTNTELADKNYVDIYYLDNKNYATNDSVNDTYNFLVEQLNEIFPQYAEKQWVEDKGYLKEIPSEYITETELNEVLANIGGGSDIPYVVIKYANPSLNVLSGDLDAVVNAIKNNKPYLAYFYNTYSTYGQNRWLYQFTLCYADNTSFSLSYHTEISSVHKDIIINGSFDNTTQKYKLGSLGQTSHNYITSIPSEYITETELNDALANIGGGNGNIVELTQEEYDNITPDEETLYLISDVAPKENLKTINGESIIGTGDIVIESNVDLSDYYTKGETDNKYQPKGNYLTSIPEEYVTDSELTEKGYATEQWVEDKGYLKEIPEEYITETELNDALANIGGGNGNVVELTQEEYNSITHDKETLYLITDATPEYNLKTINGNDIVGKGDIKVEASVDLTGYATEQWVDDKGYLKEIPSEYITETELADKKYVNTSYLNGELEGYAKLSYVDEQLGNINTILENILN